MTQRPLRTAIALATAAVASLSLAPVPAHAVADDSADPRVQVQLAEAYAATAKYLYEPNAVADGYVPDRCSNDPMGHGSMGYHYFKESLYGSTDPAKPAALLYEDGAGGKRRLAGVEWIVPDHDQNLKTDDDRPSMFGGRKFDGPMPGHTPTMPIHYDLHVWLYKDNPNGLFDRWNPTVKCTPSTATSTHSAHAAQ
ncbi:hypothetical protein ACFVXW_11455 [Streptomyces sp. NPDC058251]|uniref:hypothetical protein n=1 Tax=unclassified Streptomyces TaxID=2593676 RepID=UPI0036592BC0